MSNKENPLENFAERWPMPESMDKPEFHEWVRGLDGNEQRIVMRNVGDSMYKRFEGMSEEQVTGKEPVTEAPDSFQNAFPSTEIPDIFKSAFEKDSDSK